MPIPVIIEKSTTGAPAAFLLVEAGLAGNVGEGAISVVMEENVMSPEAAKEVIPSIVVVVAHADAGLPSESSESRFFGRHR